MNSNQHRWSQYRPNDWEMPFYQQLGLGLISLIVFLLLFCAIFGYAEGKEIMVVVICYVLALVTHLLF